MKQLDAAPFTLPEQPAAAELVAKYFRALGDPTRVRILSLLDERVAGLLDLAPALLADNVEHVATCRTIDAC